MLKNRPAALAVTLAALGGVSVSAWVLGRRPVELPDCAPDAVRVGADGVATCRAALLPPAEARLAMGAKLDLNRASAAELAAIDGVGAQLASALVEARTRLGRFSSWEEVDQVPGVGPARLETLKGVTVLGPK